MPTLANLPGSQYFPSAQSNMLTLTEQFVADVRVLASRARGELMLPSLPHSIVSTIGPKSSIADSHWHTPAVQLHELESFVLCWSKEIQVKHDFSAIRVLIFLSTNLDCLIMTLGDLWWFLSRESLIVARMRCLMRQSSPLCWSSLNFGLAKRRILLPFSASFKIQSFAASSKF